MLASMFAKLAPFPLPPLSPTVPLSNMSSVVGQTWVNARAVRQTTVLRVSALRKVVCFVAVLYVGGDLTCTV
jgi:hypothetical protein